MEAEGGQREDEGRRGGSEVRVIEGREAEAGRVKEEEMMWKEGGGGREGGEREVKKEREG